MCVCVWCGSSGNGGGGGGGGGGGESLRVFKSAVSFLCLSSAAASIPWSGAFEVTENCEASHSLQELTQQGVYPKRAV